MADDCDDEHNEAALLLRQAIKVARSFFDLTVSSRCMHAPSSSLIINCTKEMHRVSWVRHSDEGGENASNLHDSEAFTT